MEMGNRKFLKQPDGKYESPSPTSPLLIRSLSQKNERLKIHCQLISFSFLQVCVKGYYKSMSRCAKCPSLPLLITQMFFIACALFLLIYILVRDERKAKSKGRTLSDVVLARLKIVIGFYQVFQNQ